MTSTTKANVCSCGRKLPAGAVLCTRCQTTLAICLANCSAYHRDLETVATKRTRYGSTADTKGSLGKEVPMPVSERFVNVPTRYDHELDKVTGGGPATDASANMVAYDVWRSAVKWTRVVMAAHPDTSDFIGPVCASAAPHRPGDRRRPPCTHKSCTHVRQNRWPRGSVRSMLAYFDRQFTWIVRQHWAQAFLEQMLNNEQRLRQVIDRPADRWYAGKCSAVNDETGRACEAELYASADSGTMTCRACNTEHDVAARRDFLLERAKDTHVTAVEAAQALISWTDYDGTEAKLVDRIRKWRDRDKLEVREVTSLRGRDRHLYRLGDVQDLLIESAQHAQSKHLTKAV